MSKPTRVVVIDDDVQVRTALAALLQRKGYLVEIAANGKSGLDLVKSGDPDLVVSDIMMPKMDGFELLQQVKALAPECPVILITGYSSIPGAIKAIRYGAEEYLVKPLDHLEVLHVIEKTLQTKALHLENDMLKQRLAGRKRTEIVGDSDPMLQVKAAIDATSQGDISVLILGESGTGKELVAEAIHRESDRSKAPFIAINCAAIPNDLLESELFGHEKGAFSGAAARKYGLFEMANTGTLFLDEIGEMSMMLQAKILRAIESHKFRRIGATRELETDFRLICSTNINLEDALLSGSFRSDLYYRISSYVIQVPPLRDRLADIPHLVSHFGNLLSNHNLAWEPPFMEALQQYSWPGNIRELRNVIERGLLLSKGIKLRLQDLPYNIQKNIGRIPPKDSQEQLLSLAEVEQRHIARVVRACDNNKTKAAKVLDISVKTLYNKLHSYAGKSANH